MALVESTQYIIVPNNLTTIEYGNILEQRKNLKLSTLGDSFVSCVDEKSAKDLYLDIIDRDPDYFIVGDCDQKLADKTFLANNMVAL